MLLTVLSQISIPKSVFSPTSLFPRDSRISSAWQEAYRNLNHQRPLPPRDRAWWLPVAPLPPPPGCAVAVSEPVAAPLPSEAVPAQEEATCCGSTPTTLPASRSRRRWCSWWASASSVSSPLCTCSASSTAIDPAPAYDSTTRSQIWRWPLLDLDHEIRFSSRYSKPSLFNLRTIFLINFVNLLMAWLGFLFL